MKKGDQVRIARTELRGVVAERRIDNETDEMQYLVEYDGHDGEQHQRWCVESDLAANDEGATQ